MYRFKWRNEAYERFVEEAKQLTDQNKRLNLYRQADLILAEDVPLVPPNLWLRALLSEAVGAKVHRGPNPDDVLEGCHHRAAPLASGRGSADRYVASFFVLI
jgi:hypothetical protein